MDYSLKGLVPFDGDGHWYLCLDYRSNNNTPSVTYIDIECNEQEMIANSFSEYLSKLEYDISEELVIENVDSIDDVISKFSMLLNCSFPPADSMAHGYDIYRANLGDSNKPEWLWISPNLVPKGFIRKSDQRFNELKELMSGQIKRYNKLKDNSYLLSFTDGVKERIIKACSKSGYSTNMLKNYYK